MTVTKELLQAQWGKGSSPPATLPAVDDVTWATRPFETWVTSPQICCWNADIIHTGKSISAKPRYAVTHYVTIGVYVKVVASTSEDSLVSATDLLWVLVDEVRRIILENPANPDTDVKFIGIGNRWRPDWKLNAATPNIGYTASAYLVYEVSK
jgi:hypothetical protein